MYTIGLSSCGKPLNEALFAAYVAAGIEKMEISPPMGEYATLPYEELALWAKQYGVELWSFHLPFMPFSELDISLPSLAETTVAYLRRLIDKGAAIGIKKFILHPSGEPIAEEERPMRMACAKESLATLAEVAKSYGAVIAVENLPRTCLGRNVTDMEELLSAHEDLRMVFDTNHLLGGDPMEMIRRMGDKIVTLHVSDYDFVNERHWLPGEGKLDWQEILRALEEIGYAGPWLYEIGFACPNSILRDRSLTCEDFVANAKALFARQTPPILSRPKPNLGFWD